MMMDLAGENNLGVWNNGIADANQALAPGPEPNGPPQTLVLASRRTNRPDFLRGFKHYENGWDIGNRHYFSVRPLLSTIVLPTTFHYPMSDI